MKVALIFEAIDRASRVMKTVTGNLTKMSQAAGRQLQKVTGAGIHAAKRGAQAAAVATATLFTVATTQAIGFESAMADVQKVVDFPTPAAYSELSADLLKLSTRIPVTATGLAEITAEAGAAGIKLSELGGFVELTAKSAVAFDMTAQAAGDAFAKIKNVYGLTQIRLSETADSINHLSDNMASKAPQIIDFLMRAGGAAPILKATTEEMAALGSAMIATGTTSETAARGVTALATRLAVGGPKISGAFKDIGLDLGKFNKLMAEDTGAAFELLFKVVGESEKGVSALKDLVGQDFVDDFLKLANRTELVADAFGHVADKARMAGSVQREFDARAATTANSLVLFKNNLSKLSIEFGSRLLPMLNSGLGAVNEFMSTLDDRVTIFHRLDQGVRGFMDGLGGFEAGGFVQGLKDYVFGVADAANATATLEETFAGARSIGESLRASVDVISEGIEKLKAVGQDIGSGFSGWVDPITESLGKLGPIANSIGGSLSRIWESFSSLLDMAGESAGFTNFAQMLGSLAGAGLSLFADTVVVAAKGLDLLLKAIAWLFEFAAGKKTIDWNAIIPELPEGWFDFSGIEQSISDFFSLDWLPDWSWPEFSLPDLEPVMNAIDHFHSGAWLPEWTWPDIALPDLPDLEPAMQAIDHFFSGDWLPDWTWPAIPLPELPDLSALDEWLDPIADKITGIFADVSKSVSDGINTVTALFSTRSPVEIAATDPASIERATAAASGLETALKGAAAVDVSPALGQLHAIENTANRIPGVVTAMVGKIRSILAAANFRTQGMRMMDTLAAGIRARAVAVTNEIRKVTQAVRDHLPSSPAKVGPLSDLHRLKFMETIAGSIRPAPLVNAMRAASIAGLAAMQVGAPAGAEPDGTLQSHGRTAGIRAAATAPISIDGSMHVEIHGNGAEDLRGQLDQLLQEHRHKLTDLVLTELARRDRRRH